MAIETPLTTENVNLMIDLMERNSGVTDKTYLLTTHPEKMFDAMEISSEIQKVNPARIIKVPYAPDVRDKNAWYLRWLEE